MSTGSRENLEDVWTNQPLQAGATYVLQVTGYSEHGGALETECDTDHARDAGAAGNYRLTVGCGPEPYSIDYTYVMGQAGSSTCPDGYSQIMSEEECSASEVGNAVSRTYTNSFCNSQLGPKGCTLNTGHTDMWFMNCDADAYPSHHAPVCKRDSSEYFVGDYSTSYDDAKNYCADRGASLATIYSSTENELARQACGDSSCWIGLEEVGGDATTVWPTWRWRWPDGSEVTYACNIATVGSRQLVLSDFNPDGAELRFRAQDVNDGSSLEGWSLYDFEGHVVAWLTLGDSDQYTTHVCLNSVVSQDKNAGGPCMAFVGHRDTHSRLESTDWVTVVFSSSANAPAMSIFVNGDVEATSSQTGSTYHAESGNSLDAPLQLYSTEWVLELQVDATSFGDPAECDDYVPWGFENWQDDEPNNHEGNDARNAIMNCCGTDGVESTGRWYDAPDDYGEPKPLCRLYDYGGACDGIHLEAGWGEVCSSAHGEAHGCPIVNVPRETWDYDLWSCDDLCGRVGGWCERAAYMSNDHCGSDVHEEYELSCDQGIRDSGLTYPSHTLCWCRVEEDTPDEDEDTSAPTTETAVPSATVPTPAPTASPTSEPTFHTWAPTPVPACCVEQQFDATGDVVGTSCYHGRSPWEESTMADLCTAGHSDAGAMAPPFRDCSQAAMDAGSCGGDPAVYDMRAAMRKFKFRGAFTARWR